MLVFPSQKVERKLNKLANDSIKPTVLHNGNKNSIDNNLKREKYTNVVKCF